jgi:mono/diheme cytochrome c family protein
MRKLILLVVFFTIAIMTIISACGDENSIKYQRYYADGSQLYKVHCGNCHMDDGKGLAALIPPLTDTTYLRKNREKLACFIVYGLNDTIVVNNIEYQGQMLAEKHLAAIDLAKVLTYITNSYGNHQGIYDVTEVEAYLRNCNN